jgi:hypothetical protein
MRCLDYDANVFEHKALSGGRHRPRQAWYDEAGPWRDRRAPRLDCCCIAAHAGPAVKAVACHFALERLALRAWGPRGEVRDC